MRWSRTAVWSPSYDPDTLLDPQGVAAAPNGRFFVADRGHDRVVLIDSLGQIERAIGGRPGDAPNQLRAPSDVAVDLARDRLYVADSGNRRISVFRLDGTPIERWNSGGPNLGFVPRAVAVVPSSGHVYVLSRLPWGVLDRFDASGQWLDNWANVGRGPGEFQNPEDLAVFSDGRVVVADTGNERLHLIDPATGDLDASFTLPGVTRVAVDPSNDRLYALHAESPIAGPSSRVSTYDAAMQALITHVPSVLDAFAPGTGLAAADDRFAVATGFGGLRDRHGLRQYDGQTTAMLSQTLGDPLAHGGFLHPVAIDTDDMGRLYLSEAGLSIIRQLDANGTTARRIAEGTGGEIALAPDGSIYQAATPVLGEVRLRRLDPSGGIVWNKPCECLSGMGLAATAGPEPNPNPAPGSIFATDAFSQSLGVYESDQFFDPPLRKFERAGGPYAWPLDVDRLADGRALATGGTDGRLHLVDAQTGFIDDWAIGRPESGAERISIAPDDLVYVLRFDGQIEVMATDRSPLGTIEPQPAPGFDVVMPMDLAAAADGRLYLLDRVSRSIFVYDAELDETPTPTPSATEPPPCTVQGDKVASPTRVELGQSVDLALDISIDCREGRARDADIVLILDRSNSMSGDKLEKAVSAAASFVSGLDLTRHRVGLVSFSDLVTLNQGLTRNQNDLLGALGGLQSDGRTDIASALARAIEHLGEAGRPDALPVILLLTDGNPSRPGQPYVDTFRFGAQARARGVLVYTIGLGDDVDDQLLTAVAGGAERYFFAPQADDLAAIYRQLSEAVGEVVATDLQLIDLMGPDVRYVDASAQPSPANADPTQITWNVPAVPVEGLRFTYRILPQRTGLLPTNISAIAEYTAEGQRYRFVFPIPEVLVVDAAPSPTPSPTPGTSTPPATSSPGRVFLPLLLRDHCRPKDRDLGVDVMLVIDTSSSMQGAKLAGAVDAAKVFLDGIDAERDRIGLVSFDSTGRREQVLSSDLDSLRQRLDALSTGVGTRIDAGLERAIFELEIHGRTRTPKVIVLLSDGRPMGGTEDDTLFFSNLARNQGMTILAVGLGGDVDGTFLQGLTRRPADYVFAPDVATLVPIFQAIADRLPCR